MQFLAPLVEWMTQDNPADRPSASEALEQFELVVRQLKGVSIRWRLQDREEGLISHVFWDLWEAVRELAWTLKWIYSGSSSIYSILCADLNMFHRVPNAPGGLSRLLRMTGAGMRRQRP